MAPGAQPPPVGSAVAARSQAQAYALGGGGNAPYAPGAATASAAGWHAEGDMEATQERSPMELAAEESPIGVSAYQNGLMPGGDNAPREQFSMIGGESGLVSPAHNAMMASNGLAFPASPMAASVGSPIANSNGMVATNSASQRLFDVIEKSKE